MGLGNAFYRLVEALLRGGTRKYLLGVGVSFTQEALLRGGTRKYLLGVGGSFTQRWD